MTVKLEDLDPFEAYDVGVENGLAMAEEYIIRLFEEADSACSPWAIALIKGENSIEWLDNPIPVPHPLEEENK
jgi:hypothetical protein